MQEYYKGLSPAEKRSYLADLKKIDKAFEEDAAKKKKKRQAKAEKAALRFCISYNLYK